MGLLAPFSAEGNDEEGYHERADEDFDGGY